MLSIIHNYRLDRRDKQDTWIEFCISRETLTEAIEVAALCKDWRSRRHPHQYRLTKESLLLFCEALLQKESEIAQCKSFEELLLIVELIGKSIQGIGDLITYDTSERLAYRLNILPEKIYLHAGARTGAQNLLNRKDLGRTIKRAELPEPLRESTLNCCEIEDLLCMYKERLLRWRLDEESKNK